MPNHKSSTTLEIPSIFHLYTVEKKIKANYNEINIYIYIYLEGIKRRI